MKRLFPFYLIIFFLVLLTLTLGSYSVAVYAQDAPTPTPTYDPLVEPFVPENPSEYELGRNWYWHNCMTCHGDVGQGLTDDFRAIWPEDHQNCWDHGCHGGRIDDEGFPIPTIVPALVREGKLKKFSSLQTFEDFIKATHPPQDPGCLDDEQYHAIALYVFSMNNRSSEASTIIPTFTPTLENTSTSETVPEIAVTSNPNTMIYVGFGIIFIIVVIWGIRTARKT